MAGGAISFTISSEGVDNRLAKQFELKVGSVIRIGRSPVADFSIEHRGISQYHAELRLLPDGHGPPRLCVRDLSSNGTGLKRPGVEGATFLKKDCDEPTVDGAVLLIPMRIKENHAGRAWLTLSMHGAVDNGKDVETAPKEAAPAKRKKARRSPSGPKAATAEKSPARAASPVAAKAQSDSDREEDQEAARKRFVELLLKTREISGTTTYPQAEKLLSHDVAWTACDELTRKECFHIFVDHLGDTSTKKKDKKKPKDKDKDKDKVPKKKEKEKATEKEKERKRPASGSPEARRNANGKNKKTGGGPRAAHRRVVPVVAAVPRDGGAAAVLAVALADTFGRGRMRLFGPSRSSRHGGGAH
eukprot:CAMPEP_0117526768 /NCGR_PEP_ID=MMETSP0784-20121206/36454_1 /TAXON_ID=39447 /ORGANISM="" /LENGTH=358 /DNA_ID=CAMNT_0005323003 /DNA_START=31 /DNA_END=1105 /DNA_ORIENTATION=+